MAPILLFGYGNPSRGDDALGPLLAEALQAESGGAGGGREIEFLTDFQLQIEHALDLSERRLVLFADAHVSCPAPFRFERLAARRDHTYTTHAMTPASLLQVYRHAVGVEPPPAYLISLRGERFELGEDLSLAARANFRAAIRFSRRLIRRPRAEFWDRLCVSVVA